jgi:hypothetical protein
MDILEEKVNHSVLLSDDCYDMRVISEQWVCIDKERETYKFVRSK